MEVIHPEVRGRSWVSVSPLGLCGVQLTQRRCGAAAPSSSRCPQLGSLCRVRVQLCGQEEDQLCSKTGAADHGPLTGAECPRRLDSMLQVPVGVWTCLRLGEGHCDVTESCLEAMRAGDICQVLLSPLQKSLVTDPEHLKENKTLRVAVELETFTPGKETWELSTGEKLEWLKSHKQRGSERFRSGDVWGAADSYSRALRLLITLQDRVQDQVQDQVQEVTAEQALSGKEFCTIKSGLHSNLSLCQLKLGQPERARLSAVKATVLEPGATKAWYRLGCACQLLEQLQEARHAFKEVLRLQPDSAAAIKALKDVAGQEKRLDRELGLRLSKMFA
ncbi:FK506-binding protein-like [Synchiropus splendidus]|uniref:FK506-binding protein-like n=1 Tax=Synchiropus splendidus TaxID=270530 RepID=UPI00237DD005|nr:FK506-binding protein-like [Synchiropus splendidus]